MGAAGGAVPEPAAPVADLVAKAREGAPRLGPPSRPVRLVVVDGPAGSGKTTLAARLGAALPAQVLHMDDLYEGWRGLEPAWARLDAWVLRPLAHGRPGRYRRFDWERDEFAEWHDVPTADFLVVEGCGAGRIEADEVAALRIWVEAPDDLRLRRGLARDGEGQRGHWLAWMAEEREHYARNRTAARADVRLDGYGHIVGASAPAGGSRA